MLARPAFIMENQTESGTGQPAPPSIVTGPGLEDRNPDAPVICEAGTFAAGGTRFAGCFAAAGAADPEAAYEAI